MEKLSTLRPGVFLDYYLTPGGNFSGQYICAPFEDFAGKSLHSRVSRSQFAIHLHRVEVVKELETDA